MKIAIVTGGSNGIGKATALELGKRGISVSHTIPIRTGQKVS